MKIDLDEKLNKQPDKDKEEIVSIHSE